MGLFVEYVKHFVVVRVRAFQKGILREMSLFLHLTTPFLFRPSILESSVVSDSVQPHVAHRFLCPWDFYSYYLIITHSLRINQSN